MRDLHLRARFLGWSLRTSCWWLLLPSLASSLDAQVTHVDFEGFSVEIRELFTARADSAWNGVEVIIENTGSERIEPTISIRTSVATLVAQRSVSWTTVVSPGLPGHPSTRRQLLPISTLAGEGWVVYLRGQLEVRIDGSRLEPLKGNSLEFDLARERPVQGRGTSDRWFPSGDFNTLVVATGDEPSGWRGAFEDEVTPLLRAAGSGDEDVMFRELNVDALPVHVEAYSGIDRVVLIGLDPDRLSEVQRSALRAAVLSGLRVWIIPDEGGAGNRWVWPEGFQGIASETHPAALGRPFFLADEDPGKVRTKDLIDGLEIPTTLEYREGAGSWLRATSPVGPWEFGEGPEENWAQEVLVRQFHREENQVGRQFRQDSGGGWLDGVDERFRRSIDPESLFLFVVVYLLVAGPGLFLYLKRKGRLPWLLWLQPAVVAVFLVGTGLIGWAHFGVANRTDDTFILYLHAEEPGGVLLHLRSVYSSVSSSRDVSALGESLPIPVPAAIRSRPFGWNLDPAKRELAGFRTRTWSLTHFLSGRGVPLGGLEFRSHGSKPEIESHLPFSIRGVTVKHARGTFSREVEVRPGQVVYPAGIGGSDPEGLLPGRVHIALDDSGSPWTSVRKALWVWPSDRSSLAVILVAEFDPKELPAEVLEQCSDGAQGFVVVLGPERWVR